MFSLLFAGTAALSGAAPLNIIDVETSAILAQLLQNSRRGAGVLALAPEGPQSLVTGGYDTVTRVWDLRSFEWYGILQKRIFGKIFFFFLFLNFGEKFLN